MTLSFSEFMLVVKRDLEVTPSRGDCALCGHPIIGQPHDDDRFICVEGKDLLVHTDCSYERMGEEIELFPIFMPRAVRGT